MIGRHGSQPRRSRLKSRRSKSRRGRIIDRAFVSWVARMACLIRGRHVCILPMTIHHVKETPGAQKDDRRVLSLCAGAHLHGYSPDAIEHGREEWERKFGVDIERQIAMQQAAYLEEHPNVRW